MALRESTQGNKTYLQIWDSSICQKSNQERAGFVPAEKDGVPVLDKDGKQVYVKRYPGFNGTITDIEWFSKDLAGGKKIEGYNVTVEDGGEVFNLSVPANSTPYSVFVNVAGNIDFDQPVDFSAWKDKEGKTAFVLRQPDENGETVKRCHTRAEPNGMPAAKERKGGKLDFGDVDEFFLEKMEKEIIPKVKAATAARQSAGTTASTDDELIDAGDGESSGIPWDE